LGSYAGLSATAISGLDFADKAEQAATLTWGQAPQQ